jgi:hypothetical protein
LIDRDLIAKFALPCSRMPALMLSFHDRHRQELTVSRLTIRETSAQPV